MVLPPAVPAAVLPPVVGASASVGGNIALTPGKVGAPEGYAAAASSAGTPAPSNAIPSPVRTGSFMSVAKATPQQPSEHSTVAPGAPPGLSTPSGTLVISATPAAATSSPPTLIGGVHTAPSSGGRAWASRRRPPSASSDLTASIASARSLGVESLGSSRRLPDLRRVAAGAVPDGDSAGLGEVAGDDVSPFTAPVSNPAPPGVLNITAPSAPSDMLPAVSALVSIFNTQSSSVPLLTSVPLLAPPVLITGPAVGGPDAPVLSPPTNPALVTTAAVTPDARTPADVMSTIGGRPSFASIAPPLESEPRSESLPGALDPAQVPGASTLASATVGASVADDEKMVNSLLQAASSVLLQPNSTEILRGPLPTAPAGIFQARAQQQPAAAASAGVPLVSLADVAWHSITGGGSTALASAADTVADGSGALTRGGTGKASTEAADANEANSMSSSSEEKEEEEDSAMASNEAVNDGHRHCTVAAAGSDGGGGDGGDEDESLDEDDADEASSAAATAQSAEADAPHAAVVPHTATYESTSISANKTDTPTAACEGKPALGNLSPAPSTIHGIGNSHYRLHGLLGYHTSLIDAGHAMAASLKARRELVLKARAISPGVFVRIFCGLFVMVIALALSAVFLGQALQSVSETAHPLVLAGQQMAQVNRAGKTSDEVHRLHACHCMPPTGQRDPFFESAAALQLVARAARQRIHSDGHEPRSSGLFTPFQ